MNLKRHDHKAVPTFISRVESAAIFDSGNGCLMLIVMIDNRVF